VEAGSSNRQLDALLAAIVLVMAAWGGTWFEVKAVGVYTDGLQREPTISTQYIIDSDQESFELTIGNATPLLLYWLQREEVKPEAREDDGETPPENREINGPENEDSLRDSCSGSCLDLARKVVSWSMLAYLAAMLYAAFRPSLLSRGGAVLMWFVSTVVILSVVPLSTAADFGILDGGDEGDGDSSATGGFDATTDDAVSVDQFAHYEDSLSKDFGLEGLELTYTSIGFDLGLLEEDERPMVIETPPEEGEAGYESLVGFRGELVIGPGSIVSWWFVLLPLMALAFSRKLRDHDEEE